MKEIQGDIWDYHKKGWIIITTNGTTRKDGACVMGRGIAKEAAQKYPDFPHRLGDFIQKEGNILGFHLDYNIITLPVKHNWWEKADINLIEKGIQSLAKAYSFDDNKVYMVRPGCGNGQLDWKDVKPILEKYLDDRFVVIEKNVSKKEQNG